MSSPEMPKLENTAIDRATSLAKGITGAVPYAGSLIAEVIGNVIPNQRIDRIAKFIQLLEERLKIVEAHVLKARLAEPLVVDVLEDAFFQAARATSQERLEHIANVVVNGFSADELLHAEAKRMLWLLGQLNDAEIVILRSLLATTREQMISDSGFRDKHTELLTPDVTDMGSSQDEFEEAAIKESYRQHLYDLGLVRWRFKRTRTGELPEFDNRTGRMKALGSEVTRLGKMLLRYLNLIPAWCPR